MGAGSSITHEKMQPLNYEKPCKDFCMCKQEDLEVGRRRILNTGELYCVLLCPTCKRRYLKFL